MKIVYRADGCVDFSTTKAVHEGSALTPEELDELQLSFSSKDTDEDFWADICWQEPLFSNPI